MKNQKKIIFHVNTGNILYKSKERDANRFLINVLGRLMERLLKERKLNKILILAKYKVVLEAIFGSA